MDSDYLAYLLERHRNKDLTAPEREQLESYWNRSWQEQEHAGLLSAQEEQVLKGSVLAGTRGGEVPTGRTAARPLRRIPASRHRYWAAAAALLVVLTASLWFFRTGSGSNLVTKQTKFGERLSVTLPDGSTVVLNGNSSIRYSASLSDDPVRQLWMQGEAFFSVRHTVSHQPFVVSTPNRLDVRVLGTQFNVKSRRGATEVVLKEGKVKLEKDSERYTMKPGEMIRLAHHRTGFVSAAVNPSRYVSWKQDVLVFDGETLQSVLLQLQDSHGLKFEIRNPVLAGELFTGSVPNASVTLIFDKIKKIYPARVRQQGNVYIIE